MGGGVSTPGIGNSGRLRRCEAWVFLAIRDNLCCARLFTTSGSGPCAVSSAARGSDGTCALSKSASVSSARGTGTIGRVTPGDGFDESATAGLSGDTGRSSIDTVRNARAKPAGTAIQPAHAAAGVTRRRNRRSRDLGRAGAGGGGASPSHSHNPDSWGSVLTNGAEGTIGVVAVKLGTLPCVRPISSSSACIPYIPLLVAAPIPAWRPPNHCVRRPRTDSGRIGLPHQTVFR